ncbi:MAG: hypothetical protein IJG85_02035 [Eubacteriaceae bacterium]|nr:hypothetical protein [Eubacteriaceae bacterium]
MKGKIWIVAAILIGVMIFSGYMLFRSGFQPMVGNTMRMPPKNGNQTEPLPSNFNGGLSFPGGKTQRVDFK